MPLRPDTDATAYVTDRLLLGLERRVATIITTCGNWASASNPTTLWSNDASDPVSDIENLRDKIVTAIGRLPNVAVIGWQAYQALRKHPDMLDRVKYTERGIVSANALQEIMGIDKLVVGTAIYTTTQEGASAAGNAFIWGKHLWMGYVPAAPALMAPAAGYVFEWNARTIRQYREEQEHADVFEVQHYTSEKITASDAGGGMYTVCA